MPIVTLRGFGHGTGALISNCPEAQLCWLPPERTPKGYAIIITSDRSIKVRNIQFAV